MKKVAYVCGGGDDEPTTDLQTSGGSPVDGDVVDGIIPNLDLSVVEEEEPAVPQESAAVPDIDAVAEVKPAEEPTVSEEEKKESVENTEVAAASATTADS